jgi:hypothetical protein
VYFGYPHNLLELGNAIEAACFGGLGTAYRETDGVRTDPSPI